MSRKYSHRFFYRAILFVLSLTLSLSIPLTTYASLGSQKGVDPQDNALSHHKSVSLPTDVSNTKIAQATFAPSYFQRVAEADTLYREGDLAAAEAIYREVKEPFPEEGTVSTEEYAIYDPEELGAAGGVYWREYERLRDLGRNMSGVFTSLELLVTEYPEFVPGHLAYAEALKADDQAEKAVEVLENASALYPDDPDLLRAKIEALAEAKEYMRASIAARQFTLVYPDYIEAAEFSQLANEYQDRYRAQLNERQIGSVVTGVLTGGIQAITTGDWSGLVSGAEIALMLGRSEAEMGSQFAEAYKQELPLVDDEEILNYIEGMGARLAAYMGRDDLEYEYFVINDPAINAFALPGGKIFVNTGAILNSRSEAELAGLLGHEISHAALSHGYQKMATAVALGNLSNTLQIGDMLTNLAFSQFSRDQEHQSDVLGSRVLALNGYAADGLRNLMVTMREQSGEESTQLMATHPAPVERVRYLEELIQRNGYNRYAYEGVEAHRTIQDKVKTLS